MTPRRAAPVLLVVVPLAGAEALRAMGAISALALDRVFLGAVAWAVFSLAGRRAAGALAGIAVAVALGALQLWLPSLRYAPYVLMVPALLAVAAVFARGLLPGRAPILLGLVEEMGLQPADDPRFRRFMTGQCLLWAALSLAGAGLAAGAMVSPAARPALAWGLAALVAVQAVWFVLSHHYARWRYGRPETWRRTLRAMARRGLRATPRP